MSGMLTSPLSDRQAYHADGRVDSVRFVGYALLAAVVAIGLAYLLQAAFRHGIYIVVFMPLIAAAVASIFVRKAIVQGHCRNRMLGLGLAAGVALLLFFGQYYVLFVSIAGWSYAHRIDLLPDFTRFIVSRSVMTSVVSPARVQHQRPDFFNWVFFALEGGLVVGVCWAAAHGELAKAYDPRRRRWLRQLKKSFKQPVTPFFAHGLNAAALQQLLTLEEAAANTQPAVESVLIEYLPPDEGTDAPVYFSVVTSRKRVIAQVALTPAEVAVLAHCYRELVPLCRMPLPDDPPEEHGKVAAVLPHTTPSKDAPGAVIETLTGPHAGRALSPRSIAAVNVYTLLPLAGFFGGMLLALAGTKLPHATLPLGSQSIPLGIAMFILGLAITAISAYLAFARTGSSARAVYGRVLREEIAARPDAVLDPGDPQAVLVEIIPQDRIAVLTWENAADVGYMLVSPAARMIYVEGDKERYRIPFDALTDCRREDLTLNRGNHTEPKSFLLLKGKLQDGRLFECPIFMMGTKHPRAVAMIDELLAQMARATTGAILPPPATKTITLFQVKGIGILLYGIRQPEPDWIIFTTWFCLFFIPIIPLATWAAHRQDLSVNGPVIGGLQRLPHDHYQNLLTFATGLLVTALAIAPVVVSILGTNHRAASTGEMIFIFAAVLWVVAILLIARGHQDKQLKRFLHGQQ